MTGSIKMELAGIVIEIFHQDPYTFDKCKDYICEKPADFCVPAPDEKKLLAEAAQSGVPFGLYEHDALYQAIARQIPAYQAFLFHGAALEADGQAYLFTGPSGAGKSTHLMQWQAARGDAVRIINGDKPIIRYDKGRFTVHGTPWQGKENQGSRISAPLRQLYFVQADSADYCLPVAPEEALVPLMKQVFFSDNAQHLGLQLDLIHLLLNGLPVYRLHCTPTARSVRAVMATMR